MKRTKKLLSILLCCAMLLGMLPVLGTAAAATGVSPDTRYGESGKLQFTVDDSGVLTWTAVPGATSYDLIVRMSGGLVKSETGLTSPYYELEAMLDQYKKDTGSVQVIVNVQGGSVDGDSAYFSYCSPYPKLEAPSSLAWNDNMAVWSAVANADNYQIWLYQPGGSAYTHWDTPNTYYNFTEIPAVANVLGDGWFFKVKATSLENYRDSEFNESGRKGSSPAGGLRAGTTAGTGGKLTFTVDEYGVLSWNEVPGASGYTLSIRHNGDYFMNVSATLPTYDLQALLEEYRKDHGTVEVSVTPDGENSLEYRDSAAFMYSSRYGKLEAPSGLVWDGSVGDWNDVPYADGYTVYLYQPSGGAYNHWTTTESQIDFSTVANPQGDWYFKVKATAAVGTRDSEFTESPRKNPYEPSTQFVVGTYVYNDTLAQEDIGGEVMLSVSGSDYDWSADGYTEQVLGGSYVTVKARPASGYRFVEWRQGTQGETISNNIYYSFYSTGPRYLYAIFEEGDPGETLPITGVSLSGLSVPTVGERISDVDGSDLTENPSGRNKYRVIDNQTSSWKDEEGNLIEYGLQTFEAGRTYSISFNVSPKEGYAFTSADIPVELYDLYSHAYTASIECYPETTAAKVTFTFTLPGERTYEDISNFRFYQMRAPEDGDSVSTVNGVWAYNNSKMTDRYWTNSEGVRLDNGIPFVSGRTYYYNYEFTAFDGYKFAENLFVRANNEEVTNWEYIFNNERTTLHIKIPYYIGSAETVGSVVVNGMFVPDQTKSTRDWDSNVYLSVPNDSNYTIPLQTKSWYEVDAEYSIDTQYKVTEPNFRAGKQYKMFLILHANDGYKFAPLDTVSFAFADIPAEAYTYTVRSGGSDSIIEVVLTFTAQFPDGVGQDANHPAWCYSYPELKAALESSSVRYVALGDVEDIITKVEGDGLIPAISVNGIKNLNVIGNATFTAPAGGDGYKTVCALLHCQQGSTLNLSGAGKLTFKAVTNASYNAVVWNQGGSVYVDGATLIGSYNTAVYGKAIWQSYGELRISDGQFFAENALAPGLLPGAHTAVYIDGGQAWIQDGTFKAESHIDTIDLHYGLDIGQYATVDLSGGTYHGILLPTSSTPLANYMDEELYTPLSDESKFNPASEYSQGYVESGKVVRIAWMIDHVDVHINAPIAGVDITENYFNIPTSGCKVTMYYPQWYKNGASITYGTFEAGASYKVVVWVDAKADYGAEFTNGVTVAINNQSVAVDRKSEHLIAVEYDFGVCPNVVPEVELTVTAPKEGNTPSYTVGCGSDAYYAVGGSNNYTEYRKWYESSDGDDWWEINTNSKFKSGYYYKFVADIRTMNGYEFPLIDNGTIQPNVSATVNGYYAKVIKAYDQDPSRYITVEYNFGECNDDVVENITLTNIDAPVAGQTPDYTANCFGTGYSMAGTNSGNWKVNGIVWLRDGNIYTGSIMDNTEKFQAGHEYTVMIDLVADNGYTFLFNHGNSIYATSSINGNTAQIAIDNCSTTGYQVWYTFTCGKQEIPAIMLYNLDEPVGGGVPDTSVTAAYPEYYTVQSVTWTDIEGGAVGATFETGVPYQATIVVTATAQAGFTADPTVYIDGNQPNSNKITVNNEKDTVTVVYTFSKPASAPELPSNIPVSGSAVSRNGSDDAVYLLYKSSTADATILQEWAAGAYNALYTAAKGGITDATVNGKAMKEQSFTFEGVQMGVYKLAILKPGGYAPKIVGVTATGASVELGRQILLLRADVDGDGERSAKDVTLLRRDIAGGYGVSLDANAADANSDGERNAKDVTLLRRVLAGGYGVTIG